MPEGSNICILPVQSPVPYTILQKICQQRKWIFCQNVECGGEVAIVRGQAISFFSGDPGLYKLCPISEVGIIHCTDHTNTFQYDAGYVVSKEKRMWQRKRSL